MITRNPETGDITISGQDVSLIAGLVANGVSSIEDVLAETPGSLRPVMEEFINTGKNYRSVFKGEVNSA